MSALEVVFSEKSQVHRITQNDLERYKAKDTPYTYVELQPVSPKFNSLRSTIAHFPDNWVKFRKKKIVKNRKLKT